MRPAVEALLTKAESKLRVAELLLAEEAWEDAVSRAYYAAFHSISALHLSLDESYSSHSQVIGQFNKQFVKTGKFPKECTFILTRLFEDRQSADYDALGAVSYEDANQDVSAAAKIVELVRNYLNE